MTGKNTQSIQATETSFRIVEALIERNGANTTEIADHLDMTKSTTYNHLQTLLKNEYIVKNGGEYNVGLKFLRIGEDARSRLPLSRIGPKEIDKLAERTQEVANLTVEEHGRGVFIYRSKGPEAVSTGIRTGKRVSLHATAFGKAILSQYPEERVENILEKSGLPPKTENTITTREELFVELEKIRNRGYALNREEHLMGLRCVAAPIVGENSVIGAVSVGGPKDRMKGERFTEKLPEEVITAANVIEVNFTYG